MPRYALDQTELLRLVVLAVGLDSAKPDEAMAILRRAEYLAEEVADEPQAATDVAPAPVPTPVKDPLTLRTWTPQPAPPVTENGQDEAPAKPE